MKEMITLAQSLNSADNLRTINQILVHYLNGKGIHAFSFTYYSRYKARSARLRYDFATEIFQLWHMHYLEECYADVDSTLAMTAQTTLPVYWDLSEQLAHAKTPREQRMRQDSWDFGARRGVSIPVHGPSGDFANFLLVEMKDECGLANWQHDQYEWMVVSKLYYAAIQSHLLLQETEVNHYQLTEREHECLVLVSQSISVSEIAKKLQITERTVNYHIQKLNRKMGVRNKHQAVAKALAEKLIQ